MPQYVNLPINDEQYAALQKQVADYNAGQSQPVTIEQYVIAFAQPMLNEVVDKYSPATTSNADLVRAVIAEATDLAALKADAGV